MIKLPEQDKDYNCGPTAAKWMLMKFNLHPSVSLLESIAKTTEEDGTSTEGMESIIDAFSLNFKSGFHSSIDQLIHNLPALVNLQSDGEGHWVVAESCFRNDDSRGIIIYDPADGKIKKLSANWLENNWFSKRYGERYFLHVPLLQL